MLSDYVIPMRDLKPLILETLALSSKPLTKNQVSERLMGVLGYNPYSAVHRLLNRNAELIRNGSVVLKPKKEKYNIEFVETDAKTLKMTAKPSKKKKMEKIQRYVQYEITLKGLIDYLHWLIESDYSVGALEKVALVFERQSVKYHTPLFVWWQKLQKAYSKDQLLHALYYAIKTLRFSKEFLLLNVRAEDCALKKLSFLFIDALETVKPEIAKIAEHGITSEYDDLMQKLDKLRKTAQKFKIEIE